MESLNGVNAITIVFAALCIFAIAYRFYGLWVAQRCSTSMRRAKPCKPL